MSIFLLSITMILLLSRIYETPSSFSKKLYYEKIKKQIFRNIRNKMELEKSGKTKEEIQESKSLSYGFCIILITIIEILLVVYYIKIGNIIGDTVFKVLSAMQIVSVAYNYFSTVTLNPYSENIEDYKFRRIPLLINAILDYIYYVGVILYAIGWYEQGGVM